MRNRPKEDMRSALAGVLANKEEQAQTNGNASTDSGAEWGNLTIRVRKRLRRKWVASAKLAGTTLTDVIVDYLTSRYGGSETS